MKKLILALISLSLCLGACKKEPVANPEPQVPEEIESPVNTPKFKISATKYKLSVFEETHLEISRKGFTFNTPYDSVRWEIPNLYRRTSTPFDFLLSKSHAFAFPGTYKVMVTTFKGGLGIEKDSIEIEVFLRKDFLDINWNEPSDIRLTTFENESKNYWLNLTYSAEKQAHATLIYYPLDIESLKDTEIVKNESRSFLSDYITKLYGNSRFQFDGEDIMLSPLVDSYNSRFKTPLSTRQGKLEVPAEIWETPTSYIALICEKNTLNAKPNYFYTVVAEPKSSNK